MQKLMKLISVVLVFAMMAACFSGCKQDGNADPAPTTTVEETTPAPTTTAPETTPAPTTTVPETTPAPTEPPVTAPTVLELQGCQLEFDLDEEKLAEIGGMIDTCKELSYSETATRDEVEAAWEKLDDELNYVSAQTMVAQVIYYVDVSNEAANQQYLDTYDAYLDLADRANLLQKDMYEDSPVKDWFFEDWSDADIAYLLSYTSELVEIQSRLNDIDTAFVEMPNADLHYGYTDLFVEMLTLGNQMAQISGYDNYYDYKAALSFSRDYGEKERQQFRSHVKNVLVPIYEDAQNLVLNGTKGLTLADIQFYSGYGATDYDKLKTNYLQNYLDSYTGSTYEHLTHLFESGNYIMTDDPNSYEGAFCANLDYYDMSLCYFGPGYQSSTTVVHELGHYYANFFIEDYDVALDLLETQSQGNEAMLLAHVEDTAPAGGYAYVRNYEMFSMMQTIIISCMVDEFESRVYAVEDPSTLTTADFTRIINDICDEYFAIYGGAEYVSTHLGDMQWYIRKVTGLSPAYYISYATSAVSTMNLYALAQKDYAAAQEMYRKLVEVAPTVEGGYVRALKKCGAASPFEKKSFTTIADLFELDD